MLTENIPKRDCMTLKMYTHCLIGADRKQTNWLYDSHLRISMSYSPLLLNDVDKLSDPQPIITNWTFRYSIICERSIMEYSHECPTHENTNSSDSKIWIFTHLKVNHFGRCSTESHKSSTTSRKLTGDKML